MEDFTPEQQKELEDYLDSIDYLAEIGRLQKLIEQYEKDFDTIYRRIFQIANEPWIPTGTKNQLMSLYYDMDNYIFKAMREKNEREKGIFARDIEDTRVSEDGSGDERKPRQRDSFYS